MKLTPADHTTAVAAVTSYRTYIYYMSFNHYPLPTSVEALNELLAYLDIMEPHRGSLGGNLAPSVAEQLMPALLWFGRNAAEAALALLTDPPATISAVDALDAYHASIAALVAPYNTMVRP